MIWVFLLVPLLVELGWVFWPAFNSFQLSFTKWSGVGAAQPVGLDNYRNLLDDPVFNIAIKNNVFWVIALRRALGDRWPRPRRGAEQAAARGRASIAARSICRWSSPSP